MTPPTLAKGICIKDIRDGIAVNGLFLVKDMSRGETRTGSPYLSLVLIDATGEITARIWDRADEQVAQCAAGTVVHVAGQAQSYKETLQLRVMNVLALTPAQTATVGLAPFLPATKRDVVQMTTELATLAQGLEDRWLRALLATVLADAAFMAAFSQAPAAKIMHHAFVGGLLEHTLAVTRLADTIGRLYPEVDRSLLVTAAILHDIGKIREFSLVPQPFQYTDEGRLVGHMVIAVEMVSAWIAKLEGFPGELGMRLKHLILSHHGRHEFGAPTLPMLLEAFILNFIDDLDAKVNLFGRLAGNAPDGAYHWSDYQKTLERYLLVRGLAEIPAVPVLEMAAPRMAEMDQADDDAVVRRAKKTVPPVADLQERLF